MITYRANIHYYAPELSVIEKVRINRREQTCVVLKTRPLYNATYYLYNQKELKKFLASCKF